MISNLKTLRVAGLVGLGATALSAHAALVVNGDFELGNVGFSSDYVYVAPGANVLYPEGLYTVDVDPVNSHNLFTSMGDHTSGEGMMMIVNGVNGGTKVWEQTISGLAASQSYNFSFYASSVYPSSPAHLDIRVDGVSIGSQMLSSNTNQWDLFSKNFVATGSSHVLSIVDLNAEASGNDFAIDDIALVPEPTSIAALAIGLAAIRRRRKA